MGSIIELFNFFDIYNLKLIFILLNYIQIPSLIIPKSARVKKIFLCLGDIVALERVAHEFCEDISSHGVLYVEAR